MKELLIKDALILTPKEERSADLLIIGNKIEAIASGLKGDKNSCFELDGRGMYLTPGLFDLQVNGGPECNFWEELEPEALAVFSRRLLQAGVTSILPTLITAPLERLKRNRDFFRSYLGLEPQGKEEQAGSLLRMPGIHFEGPCLSPQRPGVHPRENLQPLSTNLLEQLVDGTCLLMTLAPELDESQCSLKFLKERAVLCSLGHSNASYEQARAAFDNGVNLMTHTFNALPPLHHREGGAVAAALLDKRVSCCLIPDGLHISPATVDLIYRLKGPQRTVLVSDMASVGTSQGGLVGSSLILSQGVRNLVEWGICSFREAILMASYNPASLLNLQDFLGQIKAGAYADCLLWEKESLKLKAVIFNGQLLSLNESQPATPTCSTSVTSSSTSCPAPTSPAASPRQEG